MEFEAQHVNTVFKYGSAELLQDEFVAFQTKVQDQVKLELLKSHNIIKDSVNQAFSDKINVMK